MTIARRAGKLLLVVGGVVTAAYVGLELLDGFSESFDHPRYAAIEGISAISGIKKAFTESWNKGRKFPIQPERDAMAAAVVADSSFIAAVVTNSEGKIQIKFKEGERAGSDKLAGYTVIATPTVAVSGDKLDWTCTDGDLPDEYRPTACRKK